jgi:pimeloyl-ACP methyl ester carboxylesterase
MGTEKIEMGNLVQTTTADGLILHGYYSSAVEKKEVILFVHGMAGNFYENQFVQSLIESVESLDIGLLTGNNRGNGKDTDFNTITHSIKGIGSQYELLEDAHLDITAWIRFLMNEGYEKVVLIGHSAGSIKSVRYLFEGELQEKVSKLILLAPIDPLGYRQAHGRHKIEAYLKKAQDKVEAGLGEELITPEFDHDVLSYQSFISWYQQNDLGRMFEFCSPEYNFPTLQNINIPTKIIVGSKDEFFHPTNPNHPELAMNILLIHIPQAVGVIIPEATHCYIGHEDEMVKEVLSFIKR